MGTSKEAIFLRGKCNGFIYALMTVLSVGGIPSFTEEIKVFRRQRFGGHYGEAVYVLSNFLSCGSNFYQFRDDIILHGELASRILPVLVSLYQSLLLHRRHRNIHAYRFVTGTESLDVHWSISSSDCK
ncbi:hypothetical protein PTKIN_Ptkin06aG0095600 [Pterospermum kingtungense]